MKTYPPKDRNRDGGAGVGVRGTSGIQGKEQRPGEETLREGDIVIGMHRGPERDVKMGGSRESETPSLPVHHWIPAPNTKFVG